DHHRDLRAWLDAPASATRPDGRDQDRHVMTMPELRVCKSACSLRWRSAGCRSTRSNVKMPAPTEQGPSPVHAGNLLRLSRSALSWCAQSSCLGSAAAAAIKSP